MILTSSSSRNCKMTFIIGWGFAECQILKKWKWHYLLNWVEYCDKLLRKYWYWHDLAQEIAKWLFHRWRLCRAPNSEKVKMGPISWTVKKILWWNIAYTLILARCNKEIVKWHLGLVEVLPRFKFWILFWYILIKFCIPITIDMI